ncbi:MAG TPA: hypothetical protein VE953_11010 [Terriglobales bacterium]|nr:hypothetical protein [Terriglobales bacterium]
MPQSLNAWHFVSRAQTGGVPTLAFYADIPQNAVDWQFEVQGRLAEDPLGGQPVQILRDSGTFPRRSGSFNLGALKGPSRATDEANIKQAWWMGGPFDVTTSEHETFGLMFNRVQQGGTRRQWQGGNRIWSITWYEVP